MAIPESTNDGWLIDADQKRKDVKGLNAALNGDSDDALVPFFVKAVKAWPYEYDPTKAASYDELTTSQMAEVVIRVKEAFQSLYDGILKRSGISNDVAGREDAH